MLPFCVSLQLLRALETDASILRDYKLKSRIHTKSEWLAGCDCLSFLPQSLDDLDGEELSVVEEAGEAT